jgi:chorismate mutase
MFSVQPLVPLQDWIPNLTHPLVIAGPCSAESEEQVMSVAREVAKIPQVRMFRAGVWKPRTRPNSFEGMGATALPWITRVKKETGLLTTVEVANAKHTELALEFGVDVLWIGARTSANPFSVQEIADVLKGVDIPVMVKNPVNADLALWIGALERISQAGITKLVAVHRGFSTFEKTRYRNIPMWKIPLDLKRLYPDLPMICDPSHIGGKRELIYPIAQKAMDIGMHGLIVETHISPDKAWSDAEQQITPETLGDILAELDVRRSRIEDRAFEQELETLRAQIDRVDQELLEALHHRMQIVEKIGQAKIRNGVTAVQITRWDEIMRKRTELGAALGLRPDYVQEIYRTVHEESVKTQTDMMRAAHESA